MGGTKSGAAEAGRADESGGAIIGRAFMAMERGDVEAAAREFAEHFVMEWPQAGEVYRGREAAFAAMEAHPEKPEFEGEPRIVGSGPIWTVQASLRYPSGRSHYVNIVEVRDGRIVHATEYWAPPEAATLFSEKARAPRS